MRQPFLPFNGTPFYPCLVVFSAVLALSACSPKQAAPEPVRAVKLMTVGASDLNVQGEYAAEVRARIETRLGFRVGGKILVRQAEMFKITHWLLKLPKPKWWVPVHSEIWQRPISNAKKPSWCRTSSALLNWKDAQLF